MTMPKQIDIKVTTGKPQNKHGYGTTRKCPIGTTYSLNHILYRIQVCLNEGTLMVPLQIL